MTQLPTIPFLLSARLILTTPDGGLPLGSLFSSFGARWIKRFGKEPLIVPAQEQSPPFAVFEDAAKLNILELFPDSTRYTWNSPLGEFDHTIDGVVGLLKGPVIELLDIPLYRASRVSLALEFAKFMPDPRAELIDELFSAEKHGQLVATASKIEAHMLHLEDSPAGWPLHVWTRLRSDAFTVRGDERPVLRLHQEVSTAPAHPRSDIDPASFARFIDHALASMQARRDALGYR